MPLIPPSLDDRSFDDLVQEMLASIPAHTPEWTSPQQGDPGRTLIELFAWLADAVLYRANLIPEKQRIAFLRLLGEPMQPAAAARGILALALDPAKKDPATLPAAVSVPGPVKFETLGEIDVLPVTGQVYIKAPLSADQNREALPLLTGMQSLYKLLNTPSGYMATPVFVGNQAAPGGIDLQTDTLDRCLWVAVVAGKPGMQDDIRAAMGGKTAGQQILNVGFVPSLQLPDPFADVGPRAAVKATWQMSVSTAAGQSAGFVTLKVDADTTQGLTRPGIVRLLMPQTADIGAPSNDIRADAKAGVGPKPPRIDDPGFDNLLVTWIRLGAESSLRVSWLGVNAVEIDQRTTQKSVVIGVSDGTADQQFVLPLTQVDSESFGLEIDMPGLGFQLWKSVDDLAVLQGPVPAYVLDGEAGTVKFGNQMQGMIPPLGRRIRVRQMRAGGGAAGNLPPGTLTKMDTTGTAAGQLIVQQPIATTGGGDAETLDQTERRLPARLRHQERAVTASDYQSLAEEIPGAGVGRVEVLPLFKPQTRTSDVPGVVSVMVIPEKDDLQPPCPRADRPLLETVYHYLDSRRPATAELYVIGTEYVGLGISVAVEVGAGFELLEVSKQVERALRRYLWPIQPGGIDNQGWPLGRHVRGLELEVIVSQVRGVIEVNGLNLFTPTSTGYQQIDAIPGGKPELTLKAWQLPELLQVGVIAGPDGSGVAAAITLEPQAPTDDSVAVPVVPKVC